MNDDRRRFLHVFGATAVSIAMPACGAPGADPSGSSQSTSSGGGGGGAGGAPPCQDDPPGINVGPPSSYSSNGLHKVPNTVVLIGRDAGGIYALSSLCTHSFCNMNKFGTTSAGGVKCTCHGSNFNLAGHPTSGPALGKAVLKHFAICPASDGTLRVDTTNAGIVPEYTRLVI